MAAPVHLGEVGGAIVAAALVRLRDSMRHAIQAGRARPLQPIRSQEYERVLELIEGGPTYGAGLLAKLGEPMEIRPDWEPIPKEPLPVDGTGAPQPTTLTQLEERRE